MGVPAEDPKYRESPPAISSDADRYDVRRENDDFTRAGILYRLMTGEQRDRWHRALAGAMAGIPREIIERQLGHFAEADPAYAAGVKKQMGWERGLGHRSRPAAGARALWPDCPSVLHGKGSGPVVLRRARRDAAFFPLRTGAMVDGARRRHPCGCPSPGGSSCRALAGEHSHQVNLFR
jgi:hypothetical protein